MTPDALKLTTCEVRLKAADAIEKLGHAKYALEDVDGSICIGGALNFALTGRAALPSCDEDVYPVVESMGFGSDGYASWTRMVNWNNEPIRTAGDVIARLRDGCHR